MAKFSDVMGSAAPVISAADLEGKRFYITDARTGQNMFGDYVRFEVDIVTDEGETERRTLFLAATAYRIRLVEALALLGVSIGPVTLYKDHERRGMWVFRDVE